MFDIDKYNISDAGEQHLKDDVNLIMLMASMQYRYDFEVYNRKNVEYDKYRCRYALLDEVGELTHELKPLWCWWKINVGEVNRDHVLEELIDCWHFALSLYYHERVSDESFDLDAEEIAGNIRGASRFTGIPTITVLTQIADMSNCTLAPIIAVSKKLGYDIDDIYQAYCVKNKVNWERLDSGY